MASMRALRVLGIVLALLLSGAFGTDPALVPATAIDSPSSETGFSSDGAAPADRDARWRGPESSVTTGTRAWQTDKAHRLLAPAAVFGAGYAAQPPRIHVASALRATWPPAFRLTDSLRI
jgi:hypothetical protein